MHQLAGVDASIGPPAVYEELIHDPASLERLHNFRYILVCGGIFLLLSLHLKLTH